MVIPTTYLSTLLLLLLSFACLSAWPNLYKQTGPRWRFELFYLDFSLGSVALGVLAAYTLGTLGSEISFADRILVTGRVLTAWIFAAGVVSGLGIVLVLASISLLGIAAALPLSAGTMLLAISLFRAGRTNTFPLLLGIILMLASVVSSALAIRSRAAASQKANDVSSKQGGPNRFKMRYQKGIVTGIVGGLALAGSYAVARKTLDPEFGPGPYAIILMLTIGIAVSAPLFAIFFMNLPVDGRPLTVRDYRNGKKRQHLLGFASGAVWAVGTLAVLLSIDASGPAAVRVSLLWTVPLASVLVGMFLGTAQWKEFAGAANARKHLMAAGMSFALGLAAFHFAFAG